MTMPTRLLLVEDTPSLQMIYQSVLKSAGHDVHISGDAETGLAAFHDIGPRVVLLDLMLPDRDGLDLMRDMLAIRPDTAVIVITANGSMNKAIEAMRAGAHEFLVKPFDETRLLNAIDNALTEARPQGRPAHPAPVFTQDEFTGSSQPMQAIYDKIQSVAPSMATIFITGESGTGKELCAQAIHDQSGRANGPFVPLNCGAIPPALLESEVFGHLEGSFTGAISNKEGAAAAADGGTLFLDEICELDLNLQTKLLRFLQTSTIQPVGATQPRKVNVRIICATNRDPLEAVRRGQFREDLYYRLHVVPIQMPPLRERGEDILEIAQVALTRFSAEEGRTFTGMDPAVRELLLRQPWPGNVRQLLNVIRNVVIFHDGPLVTPEMLPMDLHHEIETQVPDDRPHVTLDGLIGRPLAEIEQMVIEETISRHGGSVPKAARVLDVSPSTIYRKRETWSRRGTAAE